MKRLLILLGSLTFTAAADADELVLEGGARLSGTVSSISPAGGVQLVSPLSAEPLQLRAGAVKSVRLAGEPAAVEAGGTRLKLTDGDVLPCELTTLDDSTLGISTVVAGELKVPRTAIASLDLGIHSEKVLFSGIDPEGWTKDRWRFQDGRFSCAGAGRLSRNLDLPEQYIFRFTFAWKSPPKLQVFLADPFQKDAEQSDRYIVTFNNSGMELKRECATGRAYYTLVKLPLPPDTFPRSRVQVELRVDRKNKTIALYVDGNREGLFEDSHMPVPTGGGVLFAVDSDGPATESTLLDVKLLAWNGTSDRHRTQERGDVTKDALIDSEGANYAGHLGSIKAGPDGGTIFSFDTAFQEEPLAIPADKVSTVFFKAPAASPAAPAPPAAPFELKLVGGGSLKVESCTFAGDTVEVKHALLGKLALKRGTIVSIEPVKPAAAPQE